MIQALAVALSTRAQSPQRVHEFGTLQNDDHNHATGVEFTLPDGWHIVSQGYANDGGQAISMRDADTKTFGRVWVKTVITQQVDDIAGLLEQRQRCSTLPLTEIRD
jgi:hypothetical protein